MPLYPALTPDERQLARQLQEEDNSTKGGNMAANIVRIYVRSYGAHLNLTRDEVAKAQEALDRPEPLQHLDRVKFIGESNLTGVLIIGQVQQHYLEGFNRGGRSLLLDGPYTVVNANGAGHTYKTREQLQKYWEKV